ncbi:MAG TPA: OmpA family protein [Chitinophagaceae bacterium]|nr:OmpA family protein [Chitinophagaceae bacterium]
MSWNLLDLVKGQFSSELINQASSFLGESDVNLSKGLNAIIPAALSGIVKKAEDGDTSTLVNLAKSAFDSGILDSLPNTFSAIGGGVPSIGPGLITGLFGDKYGAIANAVSSFTGLKGATTSSLFGTVVPAALALLGKFAKETNATPGSIASLLSGQKNSILSAVPVGLNLSKFFDTPKPVEHHVHAAPVHEEKKSSLLWYILAGLGLIALLLLLFRGCLDKKKEAAPTEVHDTTVVVKTEVIAVTKEPLKVKLPNGVEINAYKGGIEDLLVTFLLDPNAKPGNDNWFDFNDLNFKFGTAEIVPESRTEVDNIAQILKAFPNAKIKLGGYTDKVGDEAANKKLSQARADAVAAALKDLGVGAQVEGAEGYGSEFAKYPATAPEEDRLKDRRVSVSVRAK